MGRDTVIPNVTILPGDPTGSPHPNLLNKVAKGSDQQVMGLGRDSVIKVVYGGWERVAGDFYTGALKANYWVMCILLCEQCDSLGDVEMDDGEVPSSVIITKYTGSQTTVDPTMAAAIRGWNETLAGTAYLVAKVPKAASAGFPRFTVLVKGRRVYDPRDVYQSALDPTTWVWSDNPALILGDYLSNQNYGARRTVDWTYVADAANYCDEIVGSGPTAEVRAKLTFTLSERRNVRDWIEALRAYVPAWVDYRGDTALVIADKPRVGVDHVFDDIPLDEGGNDNIDSNPLPKLFKRGVNSSPNVVQIGYTRVDITPWDMDYVEDGSTPSTRRKTRIDMPGIRRKSQGKRFAIERRNHYVLENFEAQISVFEDGLKVLLGDLCLVSERTIGLDEEEMVVTARKDMGYGRWTLGLRQYDAMAFSSSVEPPAPEVPSDIPNPRVVAAPTDLSLVETVYLEKVVTADSLARGLIYQSRIDATWTASDHVYDVQYRIEVFVGALRIRNDLQSGDDTTYSSPAVQQGNVYTVRVYARNSLGFESPVLEGSVAAQGKLLKPGPVPAFIRLYELGGEALGEIQPAVDIDIQRYEYRYNHNIDVNGNGSWETATRIDQVDGLRFRFKGLPVGTHMMRVKPIDSVGNYSDDDCSGTFTVTSDTNAFLQDREFVDPVLVNMMEWSVIEGVNKQRWASGVASDVTTTQWSNPVDSTPLPLIATRSAGANSFQGEDWEFGQIVTGDFVLTADVTDLNGSPVGVAYYIEHTDGGSPTVWEREAGITWKGAAFAVRPYIQALGTDTFVINRPPTMSLSAVTRRESNGDTPVLSTASGPKTIVLEGQYSVLAAPVVITPRGTSARMYSVDNVVLSLVGPNTFDVYIFDAAGVQTATPFDWSVQVF